MKPVSISTDFIRANTLRLLIFTLILMLAPHISRLPVWISLVAGGLFAWRLLALRSGWRMPNRIILSVLTILISAGLLFNFRTLFGREVGVAGLILMLAMKTLELRSLRDVMVVVCLGYFLVITGFLYSQSVLMAVYLLATVVLMTATLIDLNRLVLPKAPQAFLETLRINIRSSGKILIQAIPLMLVLFVLFPRISGPLWTLPKDASSAKSGLSETMSPGSINQLILSDDIAFRVRFDSEPPPPSKRYWRGPVFWYTDGKIWSRHDPDVQQPEKLKSLSYTFAKDLFSYEVTLEPHEKRWLFALDLLATMPDSAVILHDYQLLSTDDVTDRRHYRVSSYTSYNTGPLDIEDRVRALQLPDYQHPRTRELAGQWRQEGSDEEVVEKALQFFRNENFVYTLLPERLSGDTVDQFLFETREGFCEHYSSSFVTLMRAAGIPARVVTGYLGGEMNQFGDYMIVYQSDAHAWAEVWLDRKGWVRVDPTAAIAPERVQLRIDNSALRSGSVTYNTDLSWFRDAWYTLHARWDALNQYWNRWVIDYDLMKQADLLSAFGMKEVDFRNIGIVLVLIFMSIFGVIAALILVGKERESDPVKKIYLQFLKKLGQKGIIKRPEEGPNDFASRIAGQHPELNNDISIINRLYVQLRYGSIPSEAGASGPMILEKRINEFRKQVNIFKA